MTGLASSLRLAWRRSRVFWTLWVLALASLLPATAAKYDDIVPAGVDSHVFLAQLAANPTMRAMLGPVYDLSSAGPFTFWRVGTFTAAAAAMMSALGVIRATRAEEEDGRTELVVAGPLARRAPLAAALLLALLANLVLALFAAGGLAAAGLPPASSVLAGLTIGGTGLVFAGLGAVCAQVFESARSARSWTLGLGLGGLYLFRAVLDAGQESDARQSLRWANPLEWAALAQPYVGDRWWVLGLHAGLAALLLSAALALEQGRDLGAGLIHARPGRAQAVEALSGPWGLAWRLQRGAVLGWCVGILVFAAVMGSLSLTVTSLVEGNAELTDMFRRLGGGAEALRDAYFQAMVGILATVIGLCAVQLLARLRAEEQHGHAELLLSAPVRRTVLAASHLVWSVTVPSLLLVAAGAIMAIADQVNHGGDTIWQVTRAALVLLPGLLLVVGLAMFLLGWAPRALAVVWAVLGWSVFVTWIAPLFDLPGWLLQLHPWGHLPHLPGGDMAWTAIAVETLIALILVLLGLIGYRRRGIPA